MPHEPIKIRPIHPFPARMAPSIAMDELPQAGKRPLRVLDPMAGSGTTLVVARSRGHHAFGFDTDPLALTIGTAWCADVEENAIFSASERILARAAKRWRDIKQSEAYPHGADDETKKFIRYWFDIPNRRQLRALADSIHAEKDAGYHPALWCSFSKLIIAKSRGASLAMDLSHSRPHRVLGRPPFRPLPNFIRAVRSVVQNSPFRKGITSAPAAQIEDGDARQIALEDSSMDVVITSPPYLNAIDYVRCNKFSLVWMGHEIPSLRTLRSTNIGSEACGDSNNSDQRIIDALNAMGDIEKLASKTQKMMSRYIGDMDKVIAEVSRVLKSKGRAILVIGDCTMRGVFVSNSQAFIKLGESHGLETIKREARPLPDNRRYLPPPSSKGAGLSFQNRMREEIVLTMAAA